MSIQAVGWVFDFSESTLADRLVLLAIANHCDARGYNSYPSIDHIAGEARVARSTVYRSIDALEELGELVVCRRPGRSNMYGIRALLEGSQIGTGKGSQSGTGGVPNWDGRGPNLGKRGPRSGPKPLVTVNEPAAAPALRLPATLDKDTRARGAEFFRTLRKGDAT